MYQLHYTRSGLLCILVEVASEVQINEADTKLLKDNEYYAEN